MSSADNPVRADEVFGTDNVAPHLDDARDNSPLHRQEELEWLALYWLAWNPDDIEALDLWPDDFTMWQYRLAYGVLARCAEQGEPITNVVQLVSLSRTLPDDREKAALRHMIRAEEFRNLFLLATPKDKMRGTVLYLKRETYRREAASPSDDRLSSATIVELERIHDAKAARLSELRVRYQRTDEAADAVGAMDALSAITASHRGAVRLGFAELDAITGGVPRGDVVTLLGAPGVGKTTFALEAILNVLYAGEGVYFASLEMPRTQVLGRHVQSYCHVTKEQLQAIAQGDADWPHQTPSGLDALLGAGSYVIDNQAATTKAIAAGAAAMPKPPALIVVDYLGRMREPGMRSAVERTEACMQSLKPLALSANAAVLVLSQMSKGEDAGVDRCPRVDSGKWSQEIEAGSDFILGLWRPNYVNDTSTGAAVVQARVGVLKNRHGPLGRVELKFDLVHQSLSSASVWT